MSPRTAYPLGGMLHRAPNGDLATIQTTGIIYPAPSVVQQIWDSVTQRRSPPAWNGIEPEGALIIWWAEPPLDITCGHCRRRIGRFRSYQAGDEIGLVCVDTRRGRLTATRGMRTADPRYELDGESGGQARGTYSHFHCPRCRHHYRRRLDRLAQLLWDSRPDTYPLTP
jgi:hypothetical protein